MAVATYSLIDVDEAKIWLDSPQGGKRDDLLENIIDYCSVEIEAFLERQIITRGALTEFHTFREYETDLWTHECPVISVTSVHEDHSREYGANELLTVNTDYILRAPQKVTRTWGATGGERNWQRGLEAVKIIYAAGYATRAAVPGAIKKVVSDYVASVYRQVTKHLEDTSTLSDVTGSIARFGNALLTSGLKSALSVYARHELSRTYSRSA